MTDVPRSHGGLEASGEMADVTIEAWRCLAAWMVVYTHFWAFSGSDWPPLRLTHTGVNLFFVVSGFVFAPYLFGRQLQLGSFALRRVFRIYPAYLAALVLYITMKGLEGQPLLYVLEHLTFLHVQHKEMAFYYNPPFWSLPAEVEFYLFLPLLASTSTWAQEKWGRNGPKIFVGALLGAAAVMRWVLGWTSDANVQNASFIALHHLPGVLVEFLLGAVAWRVGTALQSAGLRVMMVTCGLAGWWMLAHWFGRVGDVGVTDSPAKGLLGALAALCFTLVVAGTASRQPSSGATQWFTSSPPWWHHLAHWGGRLSYGVYLFHMAALRIAETWGGMWGWGRSGTLALAVLLTLLLAFAVYTAWENPWRIFGRRLAARMPT